MKRTPLKRKYSIKRKPFKVRTSHKWDEQRRPTGKNSRLQTSRNYEWKYWALKCWGRFVNLDPFNQALITCMVPGCKEFKFLVADHVIPRSNFRIDPWIPTNSQIICWGHNSEKGSSHGPQWDFRTEEYKKFQVELAEKEWEKDHMGRWQLIPNKTKSL